MLEIAIKALWITLISYLLFLIAKRLYNRYLKTESDPFFYFLSLRIDEKGECFIRVLAPINDFEIDITVSEDANVIFTKNAHLKMGINRIYISTIPAELKLGKIKIQAATQTIERAFVEVEN